MDYSRQLNLPTILSKSLLPIMGPRQIGKSNFVDKAQRQPKLSNAVQSIIVSNPLFRVVLTGSSARNLQRSRLNLWRFLCALVCWSHIGVTASLAQTGEIPVTETVKVGAVLSLSGEVAWFGTAAQEGIRLALSELDDRKFNVSYDDDLSLNKLAIVNATQRLISSDKKDVLLLTAVNSGAAISSLVNRSKLFSLVLFDSNNSIREMGEYVYGFGFSNEAVSEDMADFAIKKGIVGRVGIVSAHDEWSEIVAAAFESKLRKGGGKVVVHEKVNLDENDFRTVVAKLRSAQVEAVYFPLYKGSIISFIRQAREGKLNATLLTAEGLAELEVAQLGSIANGIYVTHARLGNEAFRQKYEAYFKKKSGNLNLAHVALGYDAIGYIDALRREVKSEGKVVDSTSLRDAARIVRFQGVLGETYYGDSRLSSRREKIVVVENGGFAEVQ